jgi:hypothetical protein
MKKPMTATSGLLSLWLLILMVFFNAPQAAAQNYKYVPFADNATWSVNWDKYQTVGDTVIDNLHYLKVYRQSNYEHPFEFDINQAYLTAFLRNDTVNKRVYTRSINYSSERLLYDFSLQIGDTVSLADPEGFRTYTFTRLDSLWNFKDSLVVLNDSTIRRQIFVAEIRDGYFDSRSAQIWIEGIGSCRGIFAPREYFGACPPLPQLLCYAQNDDLLFALPISGDDTNANDCWGPIGGKIENNTFFHDIKLYPNPATDAINIEIKEIQDYQHAAISLYNIHGICLENKLISNSITAFNVSQYSSGLYFIEIRQQNGRKYYSKFIKN